MNQKRGGHFNERLMMSLIHRQGAVSAGHLSQQTELSFQTVSVILRRLEQDGLLKRGTPVRGQIGKPLTPFMIDPDGAYAFGLKVGRRSCDLVLLDLSGACRAIRRLRYDRPEINDILKFLRTAMAAIRRGLDDERNARVVGLGIAVPGKVGDWPERFALPSAVPTVPWDSVNLTAEIARFTDIPIVIENDATAACLAEYAFGEGKDLTDFGYFFVGTFVGGGLVIEDKVFRGGRGHAGAFGAIRVTTAEGGEAQLVECGSLHLLETALKEAGKDPSIVYGRQKRWSGFSQILDAWIARVAPELARGIVNVCAVTDFDVVFIDGGFPAHVRSQLVERIRTELDSLDTQGILPVAVKEGSMGPDARAFGAAAGLLVSNFFPRY
ncbi:ROK family transcriptional regulator [Martelella sp. AMO21009]